jgi:hypothetical protein
VDGFALRRRPPGHPPQQLRRHLGQADLGQGNGQLDLGGEVQHLLQHGAGLAFEDQLNQQAGGDLLAVEVGVGRRRGGQPVVDGVGGGQARGLAPRPESRVFASTSRSSPGVTTWPWAAWVSASTR